MIHKNKKLLLLTSLATLSPLLVSLFAWNRLPDPEIGWNPSPFFALGPSLIFLAVQWLCILLR